MRPSVRGAVSVGGAMDTELLGVIALLCAVLAEWILSLGGTIDALARPRAVWAAAGCRKLLWVWQVVGLFAPVGLVYSGVYFLRIRPKLIAAERELDAAAFAATPWQGSPGGAVVQAASDRTVKVRTSPLLRVLVLVPGLVLAIVWFGLPHPYRDGAGLFWITEWPLLSVLQCVLFSWFGINLTPTDAVVNSLRRHRVPWSRIQAVAQEPFLGGRRVVLWTDQGERIPLRAPIVDFTSLGARRFDRDFHRIGQWWQAHH